MSDYIIRGEGEFRIGRTILEALYSDCMVIAPSRNDKAFIIYRELDKFHDRNLFYSPRNESSLIHVLSDLRLDKRSPNSLSSSISSHRKTALLSNIFPPKSFLL